MTRTRNTTYLSVMMTEAEKAHLDAAVAASGKTRNRFLRDLIAALTVKK